MVVAITTSSGASAAKPQIEPRHERASWFEVTAPGGGTVRRSAMRLSRKAIASASSPSSRRSLELVIRLPLSLARLS